MIYKRGKTYWFESVFNGKRIQKSTHQRNRDAARDIESAERTKLAKGEVGITEPKPIPSFAEFAEGRFLEKMRSDHAAKPNTLEYYESGVKALLKFEKLKNAQLDKIDGELISDYVLKRRSQKAKGKNGKPLKVATVNRELEVLRRMTRLAAEWNIINRAPKISRLPGEVGRDRILNHHEEQAYLAAADDLLRDIATLILDGGFRPEEVFRMRWENVHFEPAGNARYGYIHNPFGKSKQARRNISMTARVKALVEMRHSKQGQPSEGWVFPAETKTGHTDSVKSQHAKALKDSGVRPPFVLYSLRHTMLTRLGEAGADAFSIQNIAGHSSITISTRYVHPTPERIEGAFVALEKYNSAKEEQLKAEQERASVRVQ